jgi:hypothetical protein
MTPSDNLTSPESARVDNEALRAELNVIYGTYRTSAMNQKYYANRLTHLTRLNRYYEIVLALGTSTAIAGWALWTLNDWTKVTWSVFSGVITLLAISKPFLKMPEDIEKYSTLHTGYRALYLNLESIVSKIRRKSMLTSEVRELFDAAQDQYKSLALNDAVNINRKILNEMQEQVNQEITVESLWYPSRQTISQTEAD